LQNGAGGSLYHPYDHATGNNIKIIRDRNEVLDTAVNSLYHCENSKKITKFERKISVILGGT